MQFLFVVLAGASATVFAYSSSDITHLQHQIAETQDRLLVAEDRAADEDLALVRDRKILENLQAASEFAVSARKLKEAQFVVQTHLKKRQEWEAMVAVERAQLAIWKLHLDQAKGASVPQSALDESYRKLWNERAAHLRRNRETWLLKHDYETEQYRSLEPLARSGAIAPRILIESDFRVKEAFHEAELSRRRSERAEKFLR